MRKIIKPCGLHCIKVHHLGVTIGQQEILRDINLHIHCGSLNAVVGRNGAGKSTLIRAILGDLPHSGLIEFKDTENGRLQKMRIGYVPQSLNIDKHTPVSVYDMIACYQSRIPAFLKKSRRVRAQILEALKIFEAEELLDRQVCNLSGGELQRVLLSMAIMDEPHLLLLDEPVSGIDQKGMGIFYRTIYHLKENYDLAIVLISHDLDYVARYADKVILLDGTIQKQGTVKEVYGSPEFAAVFGEDAARGGSKDSGAFGSGVSKCSGAFGSSGSKCSGAFGSSGSKDSGTFGGSGSKGCGTPDLELEKGGADCE